MITSKTPGVTTKKEQDLLGKVLVLDSTCLGPAYKDPRHQLVKCVGGFGANPNALGTAVFVEFLSDKEYSRFGRNDFVGIASEDLVKEYFPAFYDEQK